MAKVRNGLDALDGGRAISHDAAGRIIIPRALPDECQPQASQQTTEVLVADSRKIAGLVGPTLAVMLISEFPLVQPHLYDAQTPPVVYLSGVLMFVAGLSIVRVHNFWARNWTVLLTLTGWFFLLLGLVRMFAADRYHRTAAGAGSAVFMVLEGVLLAIALIITYQGYRRPSR